MLGVQPTRACYEAGPVVRRRGFRKQPADFGLNKALGNFNQPLLLTDEKLPVVWRVSFEHHSVLGCSLSLYWGYTVEMEFSFGESEKKGLQLRQRFIIFFDSITWLGSIFVAVFLRYELSFGAVPLINVAFGGIILAGCGFAIGLLTHLYQSRFVVGSLDELQALGLTAFFASILVGGVVVLWGNLLGLPRSVVFIAGPIFLLVAGAFRAALRLRRLRTRRLTRATGKRAILYGAGDAADGLIQQLISTPDSPFEPVALLDDAPGKSNRWIRGVPMRGTWKDLASVAEECGASTLIVAIPSADSALLKRVYDDTRLIGLQVIVLPALREYLGGKSSAAELRAVSIEDLIGRQSVALDEIRISDLLSGKKVAVTGAGGSIGSELSRQILNFSPHSLLIVDRDETALLETSMKISIPANSSSFETYLLDIRDQDAVNTLFRSRDIDVVFHAAALKHLSMLERFPQEAWKTNVEGTLNILRASEKAGISVFVNISTDKAANPTNKLGESKRLAEQLTAWFAKETQQAYVSVRFGNVLGSRGSLVPILAKQIEDGGPITLTDKDATRYFMSIPEACQLVLQAAAQGEGGDVLVLDMGAPIRILDIAERMVELSGKKIEVEYLGLRPGEKLHEDLLSNSESLLPSSHSKIFRLKAEPVSPTVVLGMKW